MDSCLEKVKRLGEHFLNVFVIFKLNNVWSIFFYIGNITYNFYSTYSDELFY